MNDIQLGSKIRLLRKKKRITQEKLAEALQVTPQAVSKWEMGTSYPDIALLPLIANYFEVTLDALFGYDAGALKEIIEQIINDARPMLFEDTKAYINTIKAALKEYPGRCELQSALLEGYEYDLRVNHCADRLEEMIELAAVVMEESREVGQICNAKDIQAAAFLELGQYQRAKAVLETLPSHVLTKNDAMAFRLSGMDKREAAIFARCGHLQDLYIACMEEGKAEYALGRYDWALIAYTRGVNVIEAFLIPGKTGEDAYLWAGMQTFHWSFHMYRAACYKKLYRLSDCEREVDIAYRILTSSWKDFDQRKDYYLEPYRQYMAECDLSEYI